jgi:hypothetical protein
MDEAWIPIIGMICVFGLPIGGWIVTRVLDHRERMAMLQRGIVPPADSKMFRKGFRGYAASQQQWGGTPGAVPPPQYAYDDSNSPQCQLRKGITTAMVGFALLIGLSFIGGLIPMFVGVAQIITALLSGAQFSLMRGPVPPINPVPPPYGSGPFPNYGPPPEAGRPGPRFEELARPVPPPDRK